MARKMKKLCVCVLEIMIFPMSLVVEVVDLALLGCSWFLPDIAVLSARENQKPFCGQIMLLTTPPRSLHPVPVLNPKRHIYLRNGAAAVQQFEMWGLPQFLLRLLCHLPPLGCWFQKYSDGSCRSCRILPLIYGSAAAGLGSRRTKRMDIMVNIYNSEFIAHILLWFELKKVYPKQT